MTVKKYNTKEEVQNERKEKLDEFDGELPSYLVDYFDKKELQQVNSEFFKEKSDTLKNIPFEERKKFIQDKEKEFWENNDLELVKKPKTHANPVYNEPPTVYDNEELSEEERNVLIKLCGEDLEVFAIRYFPHYLRKPNSELHRFIYKLLSRTLGSKKKRRTGFKWSIAAPRGHAKSTLISTIFPLWCICYNKKKFIIIISDTLGQAQDFLYDIAKELLNNQKIARDFPHVYGKGPTWRLEEIITKNDIKVLALGTGSKVRGRRFGIHRPDVLIADDLESADMVRSETARKHIRYQWFDKEVMHVEGEEGTYTDYLVIGTILSKNSLLNNLLDSTEYPEWSSKRFSAVKKFSTSPLWDDWEAIYKDKFNLEREKGALKFFEEHKEEMLEGTSVLWPEGDPYYNLMIDHLNPSSFAQEKQNEALDPTKVIVSFDKLCFEWFGNSKLIQTILDTRKSRGIYFGALDPSVGKKSTTGDYSCIFTVCRDLESGNIYVVDIDLKRRPVDDQIEAILNAHLSYRYKLFAIETNAFQYVVANDLRKRSKKEGIYVPIKEVNVYHDKKMRFEGVVPFILDGTIIFDKHKYTTNQSYRMGVEQITTFSGEDDKYDDAVDGLSLVFAIAQKPRFRMVTRQTR